MSAADFSGGFGRCLNRGGLWSRVPREHSLLVCSYVRVASPLLPIDDIHIGYVSWARPCVCCAHSSTSSHPSITTSHVVGTPRTPNQAQQICNKPPRRIKPPTGGPLLLARPRILAANRQIDACSSLSPGACAVGRTGARLFHFPPVLVPHSRESPLLAAEH